jgi:hypothetical protein
MVAAFVFGLCAPCANGAAARSFHIDPDAGDDSRDGLSPETAWKSATGLAGLVLGAGERVLFRAGAVHAAPVSLAARGETGNPAVIGRYGDGPAPVIDGRGASTAMRISNPDHLVIEDLEITNPSVHPGARNGLVLSADDGSTAENIVLRRLHIHHVSGHDDRNGGCGIFAGAGKSPDGRASRYDGLRIVDCLLHDLPFNGIFVSGWATWGRTARGDLEHPSTRILIRGNLLHDIAGDAICIIHTKGAVIEHNEVYRSSLGQVRGIPEAASAAIWPHSSDGTIMRFNRVEGLRGQKDGQAFDVDIDCRDTLIENNFTRDNGTGFLLVCSGGDRGRVHETRGVMIRNNLCVDECAEPPGALFTFVSRVRDIRVENNAFIFRQTGERRFLRAADWLDPEWPEDIIFRRNLIMTAGSLYNEPGSATGIRFEENLRTGNVRFGSGTEKGDDFHRNLIDSLAESFVATVTRNPEIVRMGFKPFNPKLAGLPRGSRLLENARQARRDSAEVPGNR